VGLYLLNKNKNIPPETLTYVIAYSKADAAFLNEGKKILDDVAEEAKKYSEAALEINGHTDNIGSEEVNKKLSLQRARSVADYLETKGINRERMKVTGFGEEKPVSQDSNSTRSGQQQNRRVEIILLADKI
jgi:outer membrane protein OmpA-like peptidoglycan-associated protein